MAAFFKRLLKFFLAAFFAVCFFISPHFPHLIVQTWIAFAEEPGTRLKIMGLAGTISSGFSIRGLEFSRRDGSGFSIDAMKVGFSMIGGRPAFSVVASEVTIRRGTGEDDAWMTENGGSAGRNVAMAGEAISRGTGFFSSWPGFLEFFFIESLNLPDKASARGVRLSRGRLSAELFEVFGLGFDSIDLKFSDMGVQAAGSRVKAAGELYFGGKKVSISAETVPGREMRLALSGEKRLFGGADFFLVISLENFTARVEADFDGATISGLAAPYFAGTAAQGLKLSGRVSVSTKLDAATVQRLISGVAGISKAGRVMVVLKNNTIDLPDPTGGKGSGHGLHASLVSGIVEAGEGYANLKGISMKIHGASLKAFGKVTGSSGDISLEADGLKPGVIPFVKALVSMADLSTLSINGRGTVKWNALTMKIDATATGIDGAINFSGHCFRLKVLEYSGAKTFGKLDGLLEGSGGLIRVHGDRTSGGTALSIESTSYELPEIGGVEIGRPLEFKASGIMEKGLSGLKVEASLPGNTLAISGLKFSGVQGRISLVDGHLKSIGFTGKYKDSLVEAKEYSHNLLTGDLKLSLVSSFMESTDARDLAVRFSQTSGWLKWVAVEKFLRVCLDLARENGKWGASGTVGFDGNQVRFSGSPGFTGFLYRALPGYELRMDGIFGFGQAGLTSKGLRLSGTSREGLFAAGIDFRKQPHISVPWSRIGVEPNDLFHLIVTIDRCDLLSLMSAAGAKLPFDTLAAVGFKASIPLRHEDDLIISSDEVRGCLILGGRDIEFSAPDLKACIDMNSDSPRLVGLEARLHGGRLFMADLSPHRIGSITLSDADLAELVSRNGIPLDITGRGSLSLSLENYGPGLWRGPVSVFLKSGTAVEGFIPQRAIDKFFETPFINPLGLNWASLSATIDTGARWILSTGGGESDASASDSSTRVQSLRIDSDKVKIGGDMRMSAESEVSGNLVAQFPISVVDYIKLGNFRTFFVRRGDELAPFSGKHQKVVYLPFRIGGTVFKPSVVFDPEKQVLRQIVGNPLKLFNFIIPNTF